MISQEKAEYFMSLCIAEAKKSAIQGQYALASAIVNNNEVVDIGGSKLIASCDPTAHPEMEVIRRAAKKLDSRYLKGHILVTTHEPCPMCTAATIWAKMDGIIFGATYQDSIEWSKNNPNANYSWRQIELSAQEVTEKGTPKLWVMPKILRNECLELYNEIKGEK